MEQPTLKPLDSMTFAEIRQELKDVYIELLDDANEDADAWTLHEAATKALVQLQGNFTALRDASGADAEAAAAATV